MAGGTIGTSYLQVVPKLDTKSLSAQSVPAGKTAGDGIANGLSAKTVAIGNVLANIFTEAATKAADLVGEVIGGAFENAAEYEQLIGGVEKLFGSASDTVSEYAQQAYKTAGISANEYMRQATSFSASLISSLGGDQQRAAEITDMAIRDMADNANVFGTNITDIQNAYQGFAKQNYSMLDNLKLGYGGTKSEMERLLEDAEKLSGVDYNIDNLADVYEAVHLIQQEMEITGTTANEAAGTIEGSMNQAKAAWDNWLTAIGTGEGVQEATQNLIDSILTALENIIPAIGQIFMSIGTIIADAFTEAFPELAEAIGGFVSKIQEIADGVYQRLQPVLEDLAPIAQAVGDVLYATICAAFDFLAQAIQTVADILSWLWDNVLVPFAEWCQSTFGPIVEAVGGFFEQVGGVMTTSMEQANQAVIDSSSYMYGNLENDWRNLKMQADGTWAYVEDSVSTSVQGAESTVDSAAASINNSLQFDGMNSAVDGAFGKVESTVSNAMGNAQSSVNSSASNIVSAFSGLGSRISSAFGNIRFPQPHVVTGATLDIMGTTVSVPTIEWYAKGGFVDGATLIGVGEAGPEMILPAQGGLMETFATALSQKLRTGNSIVINLDYNASDDAQQMLRDIERGLENYLALEA